MKALSPEAKKSILSEINNQKLLSNHPNFIALKEVYEDQEAVYCIMEENKESLEEVLVRRKYFLEKEVQYIFCQCVCILESLRKRNIFHGNISLKTLFVDGYGKHQDFQ